MILEPDIAEYAIQYDSAPSPTSHVEQAAVCDFMTAGSKYPNATRTNQIRTRTAFANRSIIDSPSVEDTM